MVVANCSADERQLFIRVCQCSVRDGLHAAPRQPAGPEGLVECLLVGQTSAELECPDCIADRFASHLGEPVRR
jgi:hypothetical protein